MRLLLRFGPLVALLTLAACRDPSLAPTYGSIELSPTGIDFGLVDAGTVSSVPLTVRNVGTSPLQFSRFVVAGTSGAFGLASPYPEALNPGRSVEVVITFAPVSEGVDSASLLIDSNARNSPALIVPLVGRGFGNCPSCADAGSDAGVPDAGVPDAGEVDAGLPDAGLPDAGTVDAGTPDAGSPDAGLAECRDGMLNGNETDVDCGGSQCGKCATGLHCQRMADCQSAICSIDTCQASSGFSGGGVGTSVNPFLIYTRDDLENVRNYLVPRGLAFKVMADLDLTTGPFTPLGKEVTPNLEFEGAFNGNGKVITGFTYDGGTEDGVGLFFRIGGSGVVTDVSMIDVSVSGRDHVGGLAGSTENGLRGISVSGTVTGRDFVGGVVGTQTGYLQVIDCTSSADVSGRDFVGGLIGDLNYGGAIRGISSGSVSGQNNVGGLAGSVNLDPQSLWAAIDCISISAVTGTNRVGGLIGSTARGGNIERCMAGGDVIGTNKVGGLVGENVIPIVDSFAAGAVTGTADVGGLVGFNSSLLAHDYSNGRVTGTTPATTGGLVGRQGTGVMATTHDSFWDVTVSQQATSATGTGKTTAELSLASTFPSWNVRTVWDLGNGAPVFRTSPTPCIVGSAAFAGGGGTTINPFLVSNLDQLMAINCNLTSSFKLTTDLDLTGAPSVPSIGLYTGSAGSIPFKGSFDGDGHTLTGFTYYGSTLGLFGYTEYGAKISHLKLRNFEVAGNALAGALSGDAYEATVTDVQVQGGNVRGGSLVGGLLGIGYRATISRCSSSATVTAATGYVGGLMGTLEGGGTISDSFSIGPVSGSGSFVAGFVGLNESTLRRSYSAGVVTTTGNPNQTQGFAGGTGTASDCYWNTTTSGRSTSTFGTPKTDAQLRDPSTFSTWDLATVWNAMAGSWPTLR